jgi:hypothetical protein
MAMATIIRVAGIRYKGGVAVDTVWAVYWQLIEAEIGVFMASATAFRTFFIARSREESNRALAKKRFWSRTSTPKIGKDSTWEDSRAVTSATGEGVPPNQRPNDVSHSEMAGTSTTQGMKADEQNHTRATV